MSKRTYDIVVFGATGFTGELVAAYLAEAMKREPVRWAIAGRNAEKLARVHKRLQSVNPDVRDQVGMIVADSRTPESLKQMAAQTRVVLTTVGPYILHGEPLVAACVEAGTDYADLTGEPEFVTRMQDRYGEAAEAGKLRIVNCCGFDSIPHDFGAWFTARQLTEGLSPAEREKLSITIEGFVRASGTFSGGTWHSAIHAFSRAREFMKYTPKRRRDAAGRKVGSVPMKLKFQKELGVWGVPFPTIDPQVVKRTARVMPEFGGEFRYGHYVQVKKLPRVLMGVAAVGGIFTLAQFRWTRDWLLQLKHQGEGPSPAERARGWFRVDFLAHDSTGRRLHTRVSGGDPGYGETSRMLAETGLCLALDRRRLPRHYGVITPVAATGKPMLERLQRMGIRFEVLSDSRAASGEQASAA